MVGTVSAKDVEKGDPEGRELGALEDRGAVVMGADAVGPLVEAVNDDRAGFGADYPVLGDAELLVQPLLDEVVAIERLRREDLHDGVRDSFDGALGEDRLAGGADDGQ